MRRWRRIGAPEASVGAQVGGTEVFAMFLDLYDVFFLSRAAGVRLPGGRPVFPDVQTRRQGLAMGAGSGAAGISSISRVRARATSEVAMGSA